LTEERAERGRTFEKTGNGIQQAQENGIACKKCLNDSCTKVPGKIVVSNKALARVISEKIGEAVYNRMKTASLRTIEELWTEDLTIYNYRHFNWIDYHSAYERASLLSCTDLFSLRRKAMGRVLPSNVGGSPSID
jgi:hypothetical protein